MPESNEQSESAQEATPQEAVRLCRNAGRDGEYDKVIAFADMVIEANKNSSQPLHHSPVRLAATVLGYKGYALMKQGKFALALSSLEESNHLRSEWDKWRKRPLPPREIRERESVQKTLRECCQHLGKEPPLPSLIKYPRTTHLFDAGGTSTTPDDLVLSGLEGVLPTLCGDGNTNIVIEEKVDGSNLGISICPHTEQLLVQNRTHYVSSGEHPQYSRITEWVEEHREVLTSILRGGNRILYGEWLVARHSLPYQKLPAIFVAFDIWEKGSGLFLSRRAFHSIMKESGIPVAPVVVESFSAASPKDVRKQLVQLLDTKSAFRSDDGTLEGIVIRIEEKGSLWLKDKFKIVRPDFRRDSEEAPQWSATKIEKQTVDFGFSEEYMRSCYPFAEDETHATRR